MRAHGINRHTYDLDLWVARDRANTMALANYLRGAENVPPLDRLERPNFKFTIGDPLRPEVEILTSVEGDPSFDDAFLRRSRLMLDTRRVPVIGVIDLVTVKEAVAKRMELEAIDLRLSEAERSQAEVTAQKERRDLLFLRSLEV